MDFIKTSSLRALIELTFQRNWNGIIWMSRKGVITKRVKTVQTALSSSAQPRTGWPRNERSALGHIIRPPSPRPSSNRPGKQRPAVEPPRHHKRTTAPASREASLAAAQPMYRGRSHPSDREARPVRPKSSANHHPPTTPADTNLGHDRSDSADDPMSGRSSRPTVQRRGRPEARFEARFMFSSPA
ncbi:unnamed protein product [Microthlaspi erraticum]|uniref:Uncharacterized protein n=1 Tax=Microthlaspi erraticum TaxID=1685480 RepID=A0A6D2K7L5_9BRAS|nr:unnamed protein product [Microthlaspi erraticum]